MNQSNSKDFRVYRNKLPPDTFAISPEIPESPPKDVIEEEIWYSIMALPDDVSLRTSDNHGTELKQMHFLWASWINSIGDREDILWHVMLGTADELQASLFNALHGYYRVSASCLRSTLELTVIGTYYQLLNKKNKFDRWMQGEPTINFGKACDILMKRPEVAPLENYLEKETGDSLFMQKNHGSNPQGGWARRLFSEFSNFVHSNPVYSHGALWKSNGPVYDPSSFLRIYELYLNTAVLVYILVKLTRPNFGNLPQLIRDYILGKLPNVKPPKVAVYSYKYLWNLS